MHTLGSLRVYINGIHKIRSFASKGVMCKLCNYRVNFEPYYEGELGVSSCILVDGQLFTEEYLHVSGFWRRRYCRLCDITLTCYWNTGHWSENESSLSEIEVGVQGHRPVSVNVTDLRSLTPCSLAARLECLRIPPCYPGIACKVRGDGGHTASGVLPVGDSAPKVDDWGLFVSDPRPHIHGYIQLRLLFYPDDISGRLLWNIGYIIEDSKLKISLFLS